MALKTAPWSTTVTMSSISVATVVGAGVAALGAFHWFSWQTSNYLFGGALALTAGLSNNHTP